MDWTAPASEVQNPVTFYAAGNEANGDGTNQGDYIYTTTVQVNYYRPTVTTNVATNVSYNSATLNGTVNANGLSTTVWFQYGTISGSYTNTSSTQSIIGLSNTSVSINISGLSPNTTYYYRIVAQNSAGTITYGSETSFTTNTPSPPSATTGSASNVSYYTATLNGTVNANGLSTTTWFQYGTTSGSYGNTSSTQSVSGTSDTTVSIDISGLSSGTTYYYRIVAQNSAGTTYGNEISFTTPKGKIYGYVTNARSVLIESVKINLKGEKTKIQRVTHSDADGFFEFTDLDADTYTIIVIKKGYKRTKQAVTLEAGEEKDVEFVMKKANKKRIIKIIDH